MVIIRDEKKNLVGYDLIIKNRSGALAEIVDVFRDHGVDIYYTETTLLPEFKFGLLIIADYTESKASPEFLLDILKKHRLVEDVVISPAYKDLIYPSNYHRMELDGIRHIIISEVFLKGIILKIRDEFGSQRSKTVLYHAGYSIGKEIYNILGKPLDVEDVRGGIELLTALLRGTRSGNVVDYRIEVNRIILMISESWECEVQKGIINETASHLLRGVIAGYFNSILEREIDVIETKCIAIGDPYCQFEITIKS